MLFAQQVLVQTIGLAHKATQVIAFDRPFEERFGRPNQDLRLFFRRHIGHTKRPRCKAFALFVKSRNVLLTAESTMFGKRIQINCFSPNSRR